MSVSDIATLSVHTENAVRANLKLIAEVMLSSGKYINELQAQLVKLSSAKQSEDDHRSIADSMIQLELVVDDCHKIYSCATALIR